MVTTKLFSGKSISSFVCAAVLKELNSLRLISIYNYKDSLSDRFILLNAASYSVLKDLWAHLDDFVQINGTPILKHSIINNKGELREISFDQTFIVNDRLLLDKLFNSFRDNKNITLKRSDAPEVSNQLTSINNLSEPFTEISFGQRHLINVEVLLKSDLGNQSYFEITNDSWFYLAPFSKNSGILQFVVPSFVKNPEETFLRLVSKTNVIRPLFKSYAQSSIKIIPVSPFFRIPSNAHTFLTGSSLMKFDPVSGYGLLNVMRSAILASATIHYNEINTKYRDEAMCHYMKRNITGMRDHITACIDLYSQMDIITWSNEIEKMKKGLNDLLKVYHAYKSNQQYHLEGFELKEKKYNNLHT